MGRWDDRICVILLNWNGKKDTIECLDSLTKCTYPKFVPVVVDNGSTDDSVEAIRKAHPRTPIFETKKNLGFAGGNNVAIEWALSKSFDWIFLLNNDTIVATDLFEKFLDTAKQFPETKIFGAKIFRYQDPTRIDHLGGAWMPEKADFRSLHTDELDGPALLSSSAVDYVCGAALFMHKSVPETIGLLEPNFFLFWEETDFCFRARRKGFDIRTAPLAHVWHKVASSFTGGKPHGQYYWTRSRLLWIHRNLPFHERRELLKTIIYPDLRKNLRHYLLKSLELYLFRRSDPHLQLKVKRLRASLAGAFDYYRGRFGPCPPWVAK